MIYMVTVPADLDRLILFFKHLLEMVKQTYPTVEMAEIKLSEPEDLDEQ